MWALDCDCGQHLEAFDNQKLFDEAQKHVNRDHPQMQFRDERVREIVAEKAYEARHLLKNWLPAPAAAFMGGGGCFLVARDLSPAKSHRRACRRTRSKKGRKDW